MSNSNACLLFQYAYLWKAFLSCRFFRHYLLLVLVSQMASGLFRLLAAVGREMVVADTFGSFAQLVLLILGGFLISRGIKHKDPLCHSVSARRKLPF